MKKLREKNLKLYGIYTIVCIVLCVAVFLPFYLNGKTFIWIKIEDGLSQHYATLAYWGQYVRTFFKNLCSGQFKLPMWNMTLGLGADHLTTLNYYGVGDPITLLSALVPLKYTEGLYSFLYLLRIYLAGLSFLIYCQHMRRNQIGSLLGSITYVFCSFVLKGAIRHPFFLNPMIYLPLLLLGIEKIYKKEKPYLFIIMIAVSALSNFYFFYMLTIAIFVYALIRYVEYRKEKTWKEFFGIFFRFIGYYILGLGVIAIAFLPIILGFLNNGRSGGDILVPLLYPMSYYKKILLTFIGYGYGAYWTSLGYSALLAIAAGVLFLQKSTKYRKYKIMLVAMGVAISLPFFGFAMNGFSYIANRWVFFLGFFLSYGLATIYPKLFVMEKYIKIWIGICVLAFDFLFLKMFLSIRKVSPTGKQYLIAAGILTMTYLILLLIQARKWKIESRVVSALMIGLVSLSAVSQGYTQYHLSPYLDVFLSKGKALETIMPKSVKDLQKVDDKGMYRVDAQDCKYRNYGILSGLNTISNYYSITNGVVSDFYANAEVATASAAYKSKGMDKRTELLSIASVKYISKPKGGGVYENPYALPFGYLYDDYITKSEYMRLNGVEKQNAMLSHAVLEQKISGCPHKNKIHRLPSLEMKQKVLDQLRKDPRVVIKNQNINAMDQRSEKEIQRAFEKARRSKKRIHQGTEIQVKINIGTCSPTKKRYIRLKGMGYTSSGKAGASRGNVKVKGNYGDKARIRVVSKTHKNYFHRENALVDLKDSSEVLIELKAGGVYTFEGIELIEEPKDLLQQQIKKRKGLQKIQYEGNVYQAKFSSKKNQIVCVPIPYSVGWKAYIDGKQVTNYQMNDMFQGMVVPKGNHTIKLEYRTPGIFVGGVISAISILILFALIFAEKRRKTI